MNEQAKNEFLAQLPVFNPADAETYDAACHCGSTQYTVTLSPPLERHPVVSCNCTICTKNGYLLVYPLRERVHFQGNEGSLNSHSFGNKRNLHKFCTTCGSSVFFDPQLNRSGDAPDLLGINIRMFREVNLDGLNFVKFDGYNLHPFVGEDSHLKPKGEK